MLMTPGSSKLVKDVLPKVIQSSYKCHSMKLSKLLLKTGVYNKINR